MVRSPVNTPRLLRFSFGTTDGLSAQVFASNKKVVFCPHSTSNNVITGSMVNPKVLQPFRSLQKGPASQ